MSTEPISGVKADDLPGQRIIENGTPAEIDKRSIVAKLDSGTIRNVHNFPGDKMEVWRQTAKATGPDCLAHKDMPADGIHLEKYFCHRVEMVSQRDGEIIEPIRCVLIDTEGTAYGFVSDFIARELDTLIEMWGNGPWSPPLHIKVISGKSRKGNNFYSIQPA